jgi:lysine-ketoglutarate reductase/saccharopine dehydrogenase-like protein (TIGR00300 family)
MRTEYHQPDFNVEPFQNAPDATLLEVERNGIMPDGLYLTTNHPTYLKHDGAWKLAKDQMMDACIVLENGGEFYVREYWLIQEGSRIVGGSREDGAEGIFVHDDGFQQATHRRGAGFPCKHGFSSFEFMSGLVSREYPIPYDAIVDSLLAACRDGYVIWVLGPAVTHSRARKEMAWLIANGFVDVLFGGNAVATHDLEAAILGTTLGMDNSGTPVPGGHRHHDDTINSIRSMGSIEEAVARNVVKDGIMHACVKNNVPYVLAGSIRDNGPMPGVITDTFAAQDVMREHTKKATLVFMVATLLHSVATGNMLPTFYESENELRPLQVICVDQDEFNISKLMDRGTHQTLAAVTNAQDFLRIVAGELKARLESPVAKS